MNVSNKRYLSRTLTTRLPESLFKHVKSQHKPSDYLRCLIERDVQGCCDDKA